MGCAAVHKDRSNSVVKSKIFVVIVFPFYFKFSLMLSFIFIYFLFYFFPFNPLPSHNSPFLRFLFLSLPSAPAGTLPWLCTALLVPWQSRCPPRSLIPLQLRRDASLSRRMPSHLLELGNRFPFTSRLSRTCLPFSQLVHGHLVAGPCFVLIVCGFFVHLFFNILPPQVTTVCETLHSKIKQTGPLSKKMQSKTAEGCTRRLYWLPLSWPGLWAQETKEMDPCLWKWP